MLLEKNAEWLIVFALSTSRLVGVVVSLFLEDTMAALSQCALGSHLLVETAEAWLDPVLERLNLPAIKNTPVLAVLAHSIIFGIGIWQTVLVAVFGAEPKTMPSILKVLLSPLRAFEFILSKFVIS